MSIRAQLHGARRLLRGLAVASILLLVALPGRAVVVRGVVTTPLGLPVGNARVQLVQGKRVVAYAISKMDGTFEIRSAATGRFLLLSSASPFTPSVGANFYGRLTSVVTRTIVMQYGTVTPQETTLSSGIPAPVQQIPAGTKLVPLDSLTTEVSLLNALRQSAGNEVVQTGQMGGPMALYVRGGSPAANMILFDGVDAMAIGGQFDFSAVSTTTLEAPEIYRGANSALFGTGAEAATVGLATSISGSLRPVLNYTGDAGNFHTYRNEAVISGAHARLDYMGAFSRINSSNALAFDEYHSATSAANVGYAILTNTLARFTLRNVDSDVGLPGPHDLYGISASGKQSNQDIYSGVTVENWLAGNWHNVGRYGITRHREQVMQFAPTGEPVTVAASGTSVTTYYGLPVTVRGANGYVVTGQAAFVLPSNDAVSNRDEFVYRTDYTFPYRIAALFSFQYDNERGRLLVPSASTGLVGNRNVKRANYLYTLQAQGDIKHKVFYSVGGSGVVNELYGVAGAPRLGLAYAPVRPGQKIFRGTLLRANVATGVQEPSVEADLTSLRSLLEQTGNGPAIAAYNVGAITAERSRTYDLGIDQNILNQKVVLKGGYFHNQFNHQMEVVSANGLEQYFNIPASVATQLPGASVNSLAYRTQGMELEVRYQPFRPLMLEGGYTYLASQVLQSFASDAVAAAKGSPVENPNLPGIAIGALSPLVGNRPFQRPPNTGFFSVQYTGSRFAAGVRGALAGRSDDSTFQLNGDRNGGNTLLLPNQNLDFGYAKLDANLMFVASRHAVVFTQLDNLLGQQHIGPIGYPGLPFTFRAGMKIRFGGD